MQRLKLESNRRDTDLQAAGGLTSNEALTPLGAALSLLPVDVHTGKALLLGQLLGCGPAVLTLAAALSVPSPFLRLKVRRGGGWQQGVACRRFEAALRRGRWLLRGGLSANSKV